LNANSYYSINNIQIWYFLVEMSAEIFVLVCDMRAENEQKLGRKSSSGLGITRTLAVADRSPLDRHKAIVPGKHPVLIPPREIGALISKGTRQQALNVIRNFKRRLAAGTCQLLRKFIQKVQLINWSGIHVRKEGIHGFVPSRCRPMKHRHFRGNRHRNYPVTQLGKQRRESKQKRLPASVVTKTGIIHLCDVKNGLKRLALASTLNPELESN